MYLFLFSNIQGSVVRIFDIFWMNIMSNGKMDERDRDPQSTEFGSDNMICMIPSTIYISVSCAILFGVLCAISL